MNRKLFALLCVSFASLFFILPLFAVFGKEPVKKDVPLLISQPQKVLVHLDYGSDLVAAGKYDHVATIIGGEDFQLKKEGKSGDRTLHLVTLNKSLDAEEIGNLFFEKGYQPAEVEELLAFGAQYPKVQESYIIATIDSRWGKDSSQPMPYLSGNNPSEATPLRYVACRWRGSKWPLETRFLVRLKK